MNHVKFLFARKMVSIYNNLMWLLMAIIMNEANPVNTQWAIQKPFQIVEYNKEFSGKFLHITGKFKQYLII